METAGAETMQIYQDRRDKIGKSNFDSDFAYFSSVIAELRTGFAKFRAYMAGIGVIQSIRICKSAIFLDDNQIIGARTSHLPRDRKWNREPYLVRSILRLIDGRWQVCSFENALADSAWQITSMAPSRAHRNNARAAGNPHHNSKTGETNV